VFRTNANTGASISEGTWTPSIAGIGFYETAFVCNPLLADESYSVKISGNAVGERLDRVRVGRYRP